MDEKKQQTPPEGEEDEKKQQTPPEGEEGEKKQQTPPEGEEGVPESFKEAIDELRAEYDKKIKDLTEKHKQEIAERQEVIKELITGKSTEEGAKFETPASIADTINKKRKYEF